MTANRMTETVARMMIDDAHLMCGRDKPVQLCEAAACSIENDSKGPEVTLTMASGVAMARLQVHMFQSY